MNSNTDAVQISGTKVVENAVQIVTNAVQKTGLLEI